MRVGHSMLLGILAMAAAPTAMAGVVFESLNTNTNGSLSNAYASGGSYLYGISTAQEFSIEDDVLLDGITFWGSSQNFSGMQMANFTGYQIIIWNVGFGSIVAQWNLAAADLAAVATGQKNIFNGNEFALTGSISGSLAAGTYLLNIGAYQSDPVGDAFVWSSGDIVGGWWHTQNPTWGTWKQVPHSVGAEPGGAFRFTGTVVPAPGAIALLGFAGLAAGRRRR